MEIALIQIIGSVLMVGLRVSGLVLFAPFFGSAVIPPRIKAVLVIAITAVLYPVYSPHLHAVTMAQWPGLVASETVVGIAMGAATNAVFEGALMAGQVLSVQMGYSLVNILDPLTQVDSTVIAFFHQSLAMLISLGWMFTTGYCSPLHTVSTTFRRAPQHSILCSCKRCCMKG